MAEPESVGLGTQLQQWRLYRGLSLGGLSLQCGVHKSTLSRWERGIQLPSMRELGAVFKALNICPADQMKFCSRLDVPRAILYQHTASANVRQVSGGELLRALRLRTGVSQSDAARAVGVTRELLSRWERCEGWPDGEKLHKLCFALGASIEETLHLTTRVWQAQEPLPNHKEGLDTLLHYLQYEETASERHLPYLALAGRYDTLYREGKLKDNEATAIWGIYGIYHDSRYSYPQSHQRSAQIASPALRSIRSSTNALNQGQICAVTMTVLGSLEQGKADAAMRLLEEIRARVPAQWCTSYLNGLARVLEHEGQIDQATQQWEICLQQAVDVRDRSIRQQHLVAMLCRNRRYREALRYLEPSHPSETRLWFQWENQLHHAWVLGGLGDLSGAQRYLDPVLPLVNENGSEYLRKLATSLFHGL
jgi:transcriptional regulator with XRE-family HTH domain